MYKEADPGYKGCTDFPPPDRNSPEQMLLNRAASAEGTIAAMRVLIDKAGAEYGINTENYTDRLPRALEDLIASLTSRRDASKSKTHPPN